MKENQWLSDISKMLKENPNKKIILIGGASSAGKTYKCRVIKNHLEEQGKKCLLVSLDNFYKPLSKRITKYVVSKRPQLEPYKKNIHFIISKTTKDCPFAEKFSKENQSVIFSQLEKLFNKKIARYILDDILQFYQNVNFDVPEALAFNSIVKQINCKDEKIKIPCYSFITSERIAENEQTFNAKDFDYIIFEGIFALREEVMSKIDRNKTLSISLKTDNLTMFSRRMRRDIIKGKRTRSPQQTFESYFEQVLPCFEKFIENTLDLAELQIDAHLTDEEIIKKESGEKVENFSYQIFDKDCSNITMYITEENDKPKDLVFEYYLDDKIFIEKYDFTQLLNQHDMGKILEYFSSCGFEIVPANEKEE